MHKKLTISIDEPVYNGLHRMIGRRKISQFIEDLVKPHVLDNALDSGYKAMSEDFDREDAALEWCNSLIGNLHNEEG